jgi:hypothetical protein
VHALGSFDRTVHFAFDSAELTADARKELHEVAKCLTDPRTILTWTGLSPAGSHQLCLAHLLDHLVDGEMQSKTTARRTPRHIQFRMLPLE